MLTENSGLHMDESRGGIEAEDPVHAFRVDDDGPCTPGSATAYTGPRAVWDHRQIEFRCGAKNARDLIAVARPCDQFRARWKRAVAQPEGVTGPQVPGGGIQVELGLAPGDTGVGQGAQVHGGLVPDSMGRARG